MIRKKRGALQLSINAIVVLILAITMLGLGLAFMRNIFGSATSEFEEVGGTVKKQMIEQMKSSEYPVDLSRQKVNIKAGDTQQLFIGFKNAGNSPIDFEIDIGSSSTYPLSGTDTCNFDSAGAVKEIYLQFKKSPTNVLKGDIVVLPINVIAASDVEVDTCFYEISTNYGNLQGSYETTIIELTVDISG